MTGTFPPGPETTRPGRPCRDVRSGARARPADDPPTWAVLAAELLVSPALAILFGHIAGRIVGRLLDLIP